MPPAIPPYKNYQDLIVYQKAKEVSLSLFNHYLAQKPIWSEQFLVSQILRASTSVGANIAEGYGRMHKKDYRRFIAISRGSSFEVEYWADLIKHIRPSDKKVLEKILPINTEVLKMLTVMMKNLEK